MSTGRLTDHEKLSGAWNFRDVAQTTGIRPGRLFRSSELSKLDDLGRNALTEIGVTDVAECYKTYDKNVYDENSMRWAVDFVDNLLYLKWQDAVKDLHAVRDPLEQRFFDEQATVDSTFQELNKKSPKKAKQYITDLTISRQNETLKMFQDLKITLITKYTNNKQGI